jgi:hypothetical protein
VATATDAGERRAWGWVAALRDGVTTPWHAFTGTADRGGRYLPGAQQLELLRRVNAVRRPGPGLVERVLAASAPGRGRPDLELVGAAEESRFGPRPVDPADLPDAELLRVAAGLIAEDVVAAGLPEPPPPRWTRVWRRTYRLVGDPWLADPVRAELRRRGRPPGGRRPTVYVLGTDLGTMLVDAWTSRAFADGGAAWADWVAGAVAHDRVPPRADLVAQAATWATRVGAARVEVVIGPEQLPRVLGVRRALPAPPAYSADAVDLARRVASPLGMLVVPRQRARLLAETLGPRLAGAPGAPLGIPRDHAGWVEDRAARMVEDLRGAGYAVHGDLGALVPGAPAGGSAPDDAAVLELAVRLLLDHGDRPPEEV